MRRKPNNTTPQRDAHRVNYHIRISPIRVIGPEGEQVGIMTADEGRALAKEHELDLVEVAPQARPPVCRVMDYGKFCYDLSKKKTKSKRTTLKTLQFRPKTDEHDLETKVRKGLKMLEEGNPIKLVMRLRGRENAYGGRWVEKMDEIVKAFGDGVRVSSEPRREGRTIIAMIEPRAAEKVA